MSKDVLKDDTKSIVKNVVLAMQEKKAKNILSLDLTSIPNAVTSYFIICHASSKTQVDAIFENIMEQVKKNCGAIPINREGHENSEWILIDYFDVVAHVFLEDIRTFYHLEGLWADAKVKKHDSDE